MAQKEHIVEQFEAAFVEALIQGHLNEVGAEEKSREYDVDDGGGLVIKVTALKHVPINEIDVSIVVGE